MLQFSKEAPHGFPGLVPGLVIMLHLPKKARTALADLPPGGIILIKSAPDGWSAFSNLISMLIVMIDLTEKPSPACPLFV